MRVTVKNEPSERGLAGVCQGPRGYIISADGEKVGRVSCTYIDRLSRKGMYWYYYASGEGIPHANTCNDVPRLKTKEEARDACVAYVKENLRLTGRLK